MWLYMVMFQIFNDLKAVLEKWSQSHPNVQLNFVNWDSYDSDPPKNLDVFVFDAIYMSYFIQQNYLLSIPSSQIRNKGIF